MPINELNDHPRLTEIGLLRNGLSNASVACIFVDGSGVEHAKATLTVTSTQTSIEDLYEASAGNPVWKDHFVDAIVTDVATMPVYYGAVVRKSGLDGTYSNVRSLGTGDKVIPVASYASAPISLTGRTV